MRSKNCISMKRALLILMILFSPVYSQAQIVINEFMAGNTASIQDENGEHEDWIELYNAGSGNVDMNNYYITDNFSNPTKFQFSASITIIADGFLILFADDDTEQGELHTNFKLSLDGEEIGIFKVNGTDTILIDSLTFATQSNDISFGRYPDGNAYFQYFTDPTPGTSNISGSLVGIAPPPVFSVPGGFYSGPQSVELTTALAGATIRYTTDGSEPIASSSAYSSAITRNATFILKAKVFAENYAPGKTVANTYFIDEHFMAFDVSERLPVVSVSCNNEFLYGSQGIIQNPFQDWEKMVNFELFEPDGTTSINQYAGLKVYGNATRDLPQVSLALFARSSYGKGSFDYKFFDDKPFTKWESIVLRDCGSDWSLTYFRDAWCQAMVRNRMYIDAQGSKHAILYLNGEFYGIIDLKEKVNEHYIEMNRGGDPDNIDMLSDDQTLIAGDARNYNELRNYMVMNNMALPVLYEELKRRIDVPNFMNLQIAQIYIANLDMFLNSKFWRERENYGKWRWIMYDTELSSNQGDYNYTSSYGTSPWTNTLDFASNTNGGGGWPFLRPWSSEKLSSILRNETFKNEFIQTFAVHINTTFKPVRALEMIDSMQNRIRNEIPKQIETYGGVDIIFNPYGNHFTTLSEWDYYCDLLREFAVLRPDYMRVFIQEKFALTGMFDLTVTVDDPEKGSINIEGIKVPFDSVGIYFNDIPLSVSSIPNEGFRFVRWEGVSGIDSTDEDITLTLSENTQLEAIFEPEESIMITEILYKKSSDDFSEFIELYNPKHATIINMTQYSITGDISFDFPDSTLIGPNEYMVIALDSSLITAGKTTHVYEWSAGNLQDTLGTIILKDALGLTMDSVQYSDQNPWPVISDDRAIELISSDFDNNDGRNWREGMSTGGSPAMPAISEAVLSLKVNEFLASSDNFFADEMNEFDDWIEILNTGNETVDLGGIYFTDTLNIPCRSQIPVSIPKQTTIKPGEHKILWADNDTEQGPLHLGFKLNGLGGEIGISADGRSCFESLSYGPQSADISYGRYADGTDVWRTFPTPTPGVKNSLPPVFTSDPILTATANELYEYNITWDNEEGEELIFGRLAMPYWLQISDLAEGSALLSGIAPLGSAASYSVGYFIMDDFSATVNQVFTITKSTLVDLLNESIASTGFTCYPNPSDGIINIEIATGSASAHVNITTIEGKTIVSKQLISNTGLIKEAIDLTGYEAGLYFITVEEEEGTFTSKLLLY
jgi:hypothetical protein